MYVDSCLFWEGTVLLSNSLIPQIREILDFRARSADASLHPTTMGMEGALQKLRAALRARESPSPGSA